MESSDHDLIVRIDERTRNLHDAMADIKTQLGGYVTKKEFTPIKLLVYGAVGTMGLIVITSIISSILKK